jgi:hypothetical protein
MCNQPRTAILFGRLCTACTKYFARCAHRAPTSRPVDITHSAHRRYDMSRTTNQLLAKRPITMTSSTVHEIFTSCAYIVSSGFQRAMSIPYSTRSCAVEGRRRDPLNSRIRATSFAYEPLCKSEPVEVMSSHDFTILSNINTALNVPITEEESGITFIMLVTLYLDI